MISSGLRFCTRRQLRAIQRGWLGLALIGFGFSAGGCATQTTAAKISLFAGRAPLPAYVPRDEVWLAAERMAGRSEGDFVLRGFGQSMEPVYHAGTAVVVHPTDLHMLRRGMAVVYRSPRGVNVAHMLLERNERGWIAVGLNNAEPDGTLVTEKNLVGVIRYAFSSAETAIRPGDATRLASASAPTPGRAWFAAH
jgi:signal peptidase I